jgi:transcriptional regulator with XRE-family HTH domain
MSVSVGEELVRHRTERGLQQSELAEQLRVNRAQICNIEKGVRLPSDTLLKSTARAVGADFRRLLLIKRLQQASGYVERKTKGLGLKKEEFLAALVDYMKGSV